MTTIQPEVTTERVAMITFLLCSGRRFRTAEIAQFLGLSRQGAYAQLARMARVLLLVLSENEWQLVRIADDGQQGVDDDMLL
jgi:hypothetical protein